MTECGAKIPEGWQVGYREGHYSKAIQVGCCTVRVHRPILDDQERARREEQVIAALRGLIKRGV